MVDLKQRTIYDCSLRIFPKILNRSGNITPVENGKDFPFFYQKSILFI